MIANQDSRFRLIATSVVGGSMNANGEPENSHVATVRMEVDGRPVSGESSAKKAVGPIDAVFQAIFSATGNPEATLTYFHIKSVGPGIDTRGRATIELQHGSYFFSGESECENVIFAAGESLVVALNKMVNHELCSRVKRIKPFETKELPPNPMPLPIITIEGYSYEMRYEVDTVSSISFFWLKYAVGAVPSETLEGCGNGLISAGAQIINQFEVFRELQPTLTEWSVEGRSEGTNDIGESEVIIGGKYPGSWLSTDIIYASIKAYLKAMESYYHGYMKYERQSDV
jgi:hypothetical protein